jgi:hypothetical protein
MLSVGPGLSSPYLTVVEIKEWFLIPALPDETENKIQLLYIMYCVSLLHCHEFSNSFPFFIILPPLFFFF